MRLKQPFLRLPKRFCAEALAAEVRALPPEAWVPHPGNYAGNDAVLLVTPGGEMTNGFIGEMEPTDYLRACPQIMGVMAEIGAVWGRSRLMGLAPGAKVPPHIDVNHHWRTHMRVHVPVITSPAVTFTCAGDTVHMAAGECWLFDSFRMHHVHNGGTERRIHLVLDTVGGEEIWELIEAAQAAETSPEPAFFEARAALPDELALERINRSRIMSPWEMRCHIAFLKEHVVPDPRVESIFARLEKLVTSWTGAWARYGEADDGLALYRRLLVQAKTDVEAKGAGRLQLHNGVPLTTSLGELVFTVAAPAVVQAIGSSAAAQQRRLAS